jgi:hypothetical protein
VNLSAALNVIYPMDKMKQTPCNIFSYPKAQKGRLTTEYDQSKSFYIVSLLSLFKPTIFSLTSHSLLTTAESNSIFGS